jgi:hypothetical protein
MKRFLYFALALAVLLVGARRDAAAQGVDPDVVDEHAYEVGGLVTVVGLNLPRRVSTLPAATLPLGDEGVTTVGLGVRLGYNVNRYVALEVETNHLPDRNLNEEFRSRRQQVFAGVRVGKRWEKIGLFAKARPGLLYSANEPPRGPCTFSFPESPCHGEGRSFFAADVGGVVEYYPTRRTILRVDAGDTIVRYTEAGPVNFPPVGTFPGSSLFRPAGTTHSFQMSIGFGFRF